MSLNKTLLQQITERMDKPSKPRVPRNQWQHPGEVTEIPSRNITMKGVSYPVLGVDANGYSHLMKPGGEYRFTRGPVTEYPMMQWGGQSKTDATSHRINVPLTQEEILRNRMLEAARRQQKNQASVGSRGVTPDMIRNNLYSQAQRQKVYNNLMKGADVATDVMQLGNFVPHPIGQAIGKAGNIAGAYVDGAQAVGSFNKGDYTGAMINAASVALPAALSTNSFRRNSKYLQPGQVLYPLSPQAGILPGGYTRVRYIEPFHKVNKMTDQNLIANRGLLGLLGAETVYDTKQSGGPISYEAWKKKYNLRETPDYNLKRAWELGYTPDATGHLPTVDNQTGQFLKAKGHPTLQLELDWYNSPEAAEFRNRNIIDSSGKYYKYVPRPKMQRGGEKKEKGLLEEAWDTIASWFSDEPTKSVAIKREFPSDYKLMDHRKISATTGKVINPKRDLLTGNYSGNRMAELVTAAKRYGIDPLDLLAIDLQETGWGNLSDSSPGHSLMNYSDLIPSKLSSQEEAMTDGSDYFARSFKTKMNYADKLGIKDPALRLQVYNGLGKVIPETEQDYHGFKMQSIYGVPIPKGGIDMRKNPLYGKRIMDIRDNILKKDTMLLNIMNQYSKGGEMIRRADGSYSRRGLWDNIRANRGSGKKPTEEMLEQERKIKAKEMKYGGTNNPGFKALPEYVQAKILANMGYGGITYPFMQQGGEPDGAMALGQIDAAMDKLMNLRKFIQPDSDLEPWVSSKLTLLDHYTDAVADYMQYNPEAQGEMDMMEMSQGGGIPQRYKNMGFTKTGVKKKSNRPGKKWMVLAKKGDDYKVVHGGYKGMQDYTQHGSDQRRKNFWNRMGGKNSSKATDPFSPLYWHKRFGTWESGGEIPEMKGGGSTWSGNTWYQDGGGTLKIPRQEDYPDYESWAAAMDTYNADNYAYIKAAMEEEAAIQQQMRQDLDADASGVKSRMTAIKTPPVGRSIDYKGPSIVDLLSQQGKTSDYASRKQLANQLGIQNYRGTADQNTEMIRKILDSPQIIDDYPSMKSVKSVARIESRPTSTSNQSPTKNKQNSNRVVQPVSTDSGMSSIDTGKAIFPIVDTPLRAIIDTGTRIPAASTNGNTKTVSNTPKQLPNKRSWWTQQWGQTADEFIANDPYFFAEESDPQWIKYADAPFTYLRNLGARTAIDLDPTAIAELLVSRYGATMGSALLGKMAPVLEKMGVNAANNVRLFNALKNPKIIQSNISLPKQVYVGPTGPTIPANAFPLQPGIHFEEGGMYINPANKGKFTTSAKRAGMGVQEFASHVLANREDYSPTQVKRANFARNASKWKKQEGGPMVGDEMDVTPEQLEMLRQMGYEFELI